MEKPTGNCWLGWKREIPVVLELLTHCKHPLSYRVRCYSDVDWTVTQGDDTQENHPGLQMGLFYSGNNVVLRAGAQ